MKFLKEYLENIQYDTIEIYSYNRGDLLISHLKNLEKERDELIRLMENEKDFDRELELNKRVKQIEKYEPLFDQIITKEGTIQKSAKLISQLSTSNMHFNTVRNLLETPVNEPIASRCIEEFRDGIILKEKGETVEAISICFHCMKIRLFNNNTNEVYTDRLFYEDYENFLTGIGHNVVDR